MKALKKAWKAITAPFIDVSVFIDEDRRQNLDGQWDKYWERKNKKMTKKEERIKK